MRLTNRCCPRPSADGIRGPPKREQLLARALSSRTAGSRHRAVLRLTHVTIRHPAVLRHTHTHTHTHSSRLTAHTRLGPPENHRSSWSVNSTCFTCLLAALLPACCLLYLPAALLACGRLPAVLLACCTCLPRKEDIPPGDGRPKGESLSFIRLSLVVKGFNYPLLVLRATR